MWGRPIRMGNKSEPNGLKVRRLMGQGIPPTGMKTWPRTGDRRRLDPRPLRVTVKGVTVYVREYQHHSEEAEAQWRVQGEKHSKEEEKDIVHQCE